MGWIYELENMESSIEKDVKENSYDNETMEGSNFDNSVKKDLTKDDILFKIEENFNTYMLAIDLFDLGEDVNELMNAINDSFDINLAILESKFGASKEDIKQYINRRDGLIKPYVNEKKEIIKNIL